MVVSVSLIANKVKIFVFALWKDGVVTVFRVCWKEEKSQMVMCVVISTKRSIASKKVNCPSFFTVDTVLGTDCLNGPPRFRKSL